MTLLGSTSGSTTSGADWFSSDITFGGWRLDRLIKIVIRVDTATVVSMTLDGTNYYPINNNTALTADAWNFFEIPVLKSDTINFKQDTGTVSVDCRVHEL